MKGLPGMRWRVLAHHRDNDQRVDLRYKPNDRIEFDELVVGDWFHMEQMDDRVWWMHVGHHDGSGLTIWVTIPTKGSPLVTAERE